ncbi:MAG: putative metalloprotease with PDZ domain, partial [Crocinitomix sp.]
MLTFRPKSIQMKKSIFLLLGFIYFSLSSYAVNVDYTLGMSHPNSHYFEVDMEISDLKEKFIIVKMPVWAPGSYLVREFAKSVNQVKAVDGAGNALNVKKINKNSWRIETKKIKTVKISYEVYAFELSVRTSFLDDSHGYVNGTSMFMYLNENKEVGGQLTIKPHQSFSKISTAMKSKGGNVYDFNDYDHLVDCPIEIGNQSEFHFDAAGVDHTVAMYGEGNYDIPTLKKDMAKIVEAETIIMGENPNKEYLFIIHNITVPSGGLEHKNSTTLQVNRWTYEGDAYLGFISLVAHEYFHLWNVKRMRPKTLGPFDYDSENYTDLLWVMEGFTSYYDELALRRAGFYTQEEYLGKLFSTINYVENQPGNRVQPVAHASFDAWIKAYRSNENSVNTTISYYSKGQILAAMLDVYIIHKFNAEKTLDDFMRMLYADFYKKSDVGYSEDEFQASLESFLGEDMNWFFDKYVYGTQLVNYKKFFKGVGLDIVDKSTKPSPTLGVKTKNSGGKLIISTVYAGSAAEQYGLSVNDEIIAFEGYRVDQGDFSDFVQTKLAGDKFDLLIARDNILM